MDLKHSKFFSIICLCLICMQIISVNAQKTTPKRRKYTQQEIDEAWGRMIKRERYYLKWANQTGCWPNNFIPFIIRSGFANDQINNIYKHIHQIQNKTCIRWVEKNRFERMTKMIEFVPEPNNTEICSTRDIILHPSGFVTRILLGDDCFPNESVIHEIMHALGILHEHQRIDRDCYVDVNSRKAQTTQFKIVYDDLAFERWPYDKRSIVHYNRNSFVITDKDEGFWDLPWDYRLGDSYGFWGKRQGQLTCMDVQKLNYRFCGGPDFCDIHPIRCDEIEEQENKSGCKQLYVDIAKGVVTPTNKNNG